MEFVGGFVQLLLLPAILIAVIVAIARRRGRADRGAPGIGTRQAFFYLFAFAALMVGASGASVLIGYVVDSLRGGRIVAPGEEQLALGLALTLVGIPAWMFTWRRLQGASSTSLAERWSTVRELYVYMVEAVSLSFLAIGSTSLINTLLGGDRLQGTGVAWPVVWGVIWAYHWWAESRRSAPDRAATPFRSLYVYLASMAALVMLLVGLSIVLHRLFDRAYVLLLLDDELVLPVLWGQPAKTGLAVAIVGGLGWWWHWFRPAETEAHGLARQVYIYIFGVLFGFVTVVVSVTLVFVNVLQWLLSTPTIQPASEHFRIMAGLAPALLAGLSLWAYHNAVLRQEAASADAGSTQRAYNYLLASLGLATLGAGMIFLVTLFVSASVRSARSYLIQGEGWQGHLSIVLPLLVVGGALWGIYWSRVQRLALEAPLELESTARRVHIYAVFGVTALAALGSLSATLYLLLADLLENTLSGETLRDAQWAIAVLLVSGLVSGYYALVIRDDRRALAGRQPSVARVRKKVTVLAPESTIASLRGIETLLGYDVEFWLETGAGASPEITSERILEAANRISSAPTERVLLIVGPGRLEVRPYSRE